MIALEKTLDELGKVARGRSRHRPRDAAHLYGGPYPFVQTGDIKRALFYVTNYSQTYSEAGLEQSKMWPAGTLCITIAANIADTAILGIDACFPDSIIGFIAEPQESDARYIKYHLDTIKHRYQQISQGVAQDNLSMEKLLSFRLHVPEVAIQRRIADILSAYDDLIENNRRRMALLEQAARMIYREWFVRLRFPGHETARIVDGVPEGWEKTTVSESTAMIRRGITPRYDDEAQGLVINQKCIRNGRLDMSLSRRQSKDFRPELQIKPGDVLVNSTGEGTLGRLAQVKDSIPACTIDSHVTIVRPHPSCGMHYFGLAMLDWEPSLSSMGRGATNQTELSRESIGECVLLMPEGSVLDAFEEHITPTYAQMRNLQVQNQRLRQARDILLPKLMSGEIEVPGTTDGMERELVTA